MRWGSKAGIDLIAYFLLKFDGDKWRDEWADVSLGVSNKLLSHPRVVPVII